MIMGSRSVSEARARGGKHYALGKICVVFATIRRKAAPAPLVSRASVVLGRATPLPYVAVLHTAYVSFTHTLT